MAKNSFIFNAEFKKLETALSQVIAELNSFGDNLKTTTKDVKKLSKAYKGVSDKVDEGKDKVKENEKAHKDLAKKGKKDLNGLEKFWQELNKEVSVALGRISKYTALYKAFRFVTDSIVEQAKAFVGLNDSFLDIARVADLTVAEIKDLQQVTLGLAGAYGIASAESAGIAKIWVQQGKRAEELTSLVRQTSVAVSALGISSQEASEALTILQRVFDIAPDSLEAYIDKIKAVESQNAVTTRFLVQAYTKIGVAANNVGVDIDTLNGLLTVLGETTRQSGSYVGNFFKVAFARLQRPTVIKYLEQIGVLNEKNITTFDSMEDKLDIIANSWSKLNSVQRFNIAELAGGLRRYQDFVTLMDNYDRSIKVAADSVNSFGTAQAAVEKRLLQTKVQVQSLQSEFSKMLTTMGAPELLRSTVAGLSTISGAMGSLGESMGKVSDGSKFAVSGILAFTSAILTFKGVMMSTVPTFALLAGGISAITFGLSAVGFAFEDSEKAMERNTKELSNMISSYKEAEKSIKNLSEIISRRLILRLNDIRDISEGQDILTSLFSAAGQKNVKLTSDDLERFNDIIKDIQSGKINKGGVEDFVTDLLGRTSNLSDKLADQISKISGIGEDAAKNAIKQTELFKKGFINSLRSFADEYEDVSKEIERIKEGQGKIFELRGSGESPFLGIQENEIPQIEKLQERLSEISGSVGISDPKTMRKLAKALLLVIETNPELQKTSDAIANLVTGKSTELRTGAIQILRDYAKTIQNLNETISGADLKSKVEGFAKSLDLSETLAESLFGDQADFEKNKEKYIDAVQKTLETLDESYKKFFNDLEKQSAVDFLSGKFTNTRSLESYLSTNIKALEITKKRGAENEAQIKRLKLIESIEGEIAKAKRLSGNEALTKAELSSLQEVINQGEKNLKILNDENSSLNKQIALWVRLTEQQKESSKLSQLESGLMNRIKSARTSVEAESMLLEARLAGVDASERELKLRIAIADAEKEGVDVTALKNALNEANITSSEKYNKSLQKTIELQDDLKSKFAGVLTSLPERIRDAADSFDEVNAGLSNASEDYRVAVNALQEAERQFNATGLSQYQNAMESAREDVQKARDAYNDMVDQSKELNDQANITKQLFGDIMDILREKMLDKFTEQLVSQGGMLDGIAGLGAGLFGSGTPKKAGLNKKDVKDGTESGQLKAAPTVGKIIANALISSSLFQGNKSAQTGSAIGSVLSNFVNPGSVFGMAGGLIGGLIGGAFGSKKETYAVPDLSIPNIPDIVKNTDAVVENTSEIQKLNTNLINAPSGFSLPALPSLSGGQPSINIQNLNLSGVNDLDSLEGRIAESLRRQLITG